ncbi:MAG: c-type cytochrome [Anaeromyxobacteraceae bacterium]
MKHLVKQLVVLVALAALAAPVAAAAQAKPEEAIRARQSIMRVIALNFGPLGKMGSGDVAFNKDVFQANAARVEALWAMNPGQFFVPGSDKPVTGAKIATFTDAKPEIWSQHDKFKAAAERTTQQIAGLAQAARTGDEKAMRAAAGEVGKSCKGCHDDFRAK